MLATAQASLTQPGSDGVPVERVRALASYGDLAALDAEVRTSATPPELPDIGSCIDARMAPEGSPGDLPFLRRFEMRLDPATVGWAVGEPSGRGVIQAWLRMADGREPDPLLLLLAVDALPPVTFDLGIQGWAPTLELSAHAPGPAGPGVAAGAGVDPQPRGRAARGGRRGVGLHRPAGRTVAAARPGAPLAPALSSGLALPAHLVQVDGEDETLSRVLRDRPQLTARRPVADILRSDRQRLRDLAETIRARATNRLPSVWRPRLEVRGNSLPRAATAPCICGTPPSSSSPGRARPPRRRRGSRPVSASERAG